MPRRHNQQRQRRHLHRPPRLKAFTRAELPRSARCRPRDFLAPPSLSALGSAAGAAGSGYGTAVAYQVDVAHDGVQVDSALQLPFAQRWAVTLPDAVSYPLIAEGKVFVTASAYPSDGTVLYALDQVTGSVVWSEPVPGTYHWSMAACPSVRSGSR